MGIAISASQELESGAGFYAFSGAVACSTNNKSVIIITNSGYRDTLMEITVSGSTTLADLTTGSISAFTTYLNDDIINTVRLCSFDPNINNPSFATFSFFVPRHSVVRIDQQDSDTTGSCTTMLRGYYMEPPVMQQD
tara:strand:- start:230 stop:640 length:411 start_codon:yes stop_codon:yes gene_type:complete